MLSLFALLAMPVSAQPTPIDDAQVAEHIDRIAEKLDISEEVADELASLVSEHRTTMTAHREAVKTTAEALREAHTSADESAMKRQLKELERLRDRGRQLHDRHQDDIMALLTVEQQAQWALFGLRRQAKRHRGGLPKNPR